MNATPSPLPPTTSAPAPATRTVEVGRGLDWLKAGWNVFLRNPGTWLAIAVLWIVIMSALSVLPGIGQVAIVLINPVLVAGALTGCQALEAGEPLQVPQLFEGFRRNTAPLLVLGAILAAASFAAGLLALSLFGGAAATGALFGDGLIFGVGLVSGVVLGAGGALLVGIPIAMASWFAPALVMFNGVAPVEALKASFFACLHSPGAVLVFGVLTAVLFFIAMIPFGLGMVVLLPILSGALYQSWRDVFEAPSAPAMETP